MNEIFSPEEIESAIGENIKSLRLQKNLTQDSLAARAGVSLSALRHLESGSGANLTTLISIARALDKQDWLLGIAPRVTLNPLHMVPSGGLRQRARHRKKDHGE